VVQSTCYSGASNGASAGATSNGVDLEAPVRILCLTIAPALAAEVLSLSKDEGSRFELMRRKDMQVFGRTLTFEYGIVRKTKNW